MKKEVFTVLFLILLLPLCSAELFISQPKSTYNVRDSFLFNVSIITSTSTNNFFIAKIVCPQENSSGEVEIYRAPLSLNAGLQKSIEVSGRFDNFLIGDLGGTCHLSAKYGSEEANTPDFEVTRNVFITFTTDKVTMVPNERFNISGKAIKSNGAVVNGFIELRIPELEITSFKTVEAGKFVVILAVPDNAPAGSYDISMKVYEKDEEGKITNEGEINTSIRIKQVLRKSEIAINEQTIKPENEFVYTALLYDQSGEDIADNVEISIYNPNNEVFLNKLVKSGEANTWFIEGNTLPGSWKIESKLNSFQSNRTFYVEEFENVDFKLANDTLTIINTGNVPYKKNIEVIIGNESEVKEVYIGVGEVRKYALSAPDGEYEIGVNDGQNGQILGTSFLTGRAISVESEGEGGFWRSSSLWIWILLIGICALIAIQQYGRISKKAYYGQTPSEYPAPINLSADSKSNPVIAESVREECSVISLKIKNNEEIENAKGDAMSALERALTRAKDAKAKIYSDRGYKTIIFAPSLTKEKDNSMKAVEIAREIESILNEHNDRLNEKIMFGIGVNNGEMIIEPSQSGELKFNSIGNMMPYTKKIADSVSYGTGVSEMVHRRILGKVKSDRVEGTNYWRIRKIMDRERHSEFISRFVERQKREAREAALKRK